MDVHSSDGDNDPPVDWSCFRIPRKHIFCFDVLCMRIDVGSRGLLMNEIPKNSAE